MNAAADAGIEGRSSMSKQELADAITRRVRRTVLGPLVAGERLASTRHGEEAGWPSRRS